jgi:CRISPR-associated protein Cas2
MSVTVPVTFLIAYDIRDPRRLVCVHRFLRGYAIPVQYSVFIGYFSQRKLHEVEHGLHERIDPRQDDVRIYPLPKRCESVTLGPRLLPEGVTLLADKLQVLPTGSKQRTATEV